MIGKIIQNINKDQNSIGVFLDLSKAFDTIDHNILLFKLYRYGFRGIVLDWFKSYLSNRKMFVKIESPYNDRNYYSDTTDISIGVPQGSVLGPLLFIVYMNDVQSCLKKSEAFLFADDTTILCSNKDFDILYHEIEIDLANLIDWFNANKLSLNIEKTNYILFKAKNSNFSAKRELSIVNKVINNVTQTKFLGLYIDDKLSWNKHINNLITKLIKNTYLINTSKRLIPGWAKCSLYNAHIKSHISYGILLWGPMCTKRNIDKLFKIQKKKYT